MDNYTKTVVTGIAILLLWIGASLESRATKDSVEDVDVQLQELDIRLRTLQSTVESIEETMQSVEGEVQGISIGVCTNPRIC